MHTFQFTYRIQNPDIPRTGRDGAAHGGAGPGRSGRDADGTVRPEYNRLFFPQTIKKTPLGVILETRTIELVEPKTRTHHGRVGSGGAQWGGWALVPSRASKTTVLNVSSEERTREFLFKPLGEQSPRLTRG